MKVDIVEVYGEVVPGIGSSQMVQQCFVQELHAIHGVADPSKDKEDPSGSKTKYDPLSG